jgi:hypothetical protein
MSVKWTARALTTTLTLVFLTQPGFAATHARARAVSGNSSAAASHKTLERVMKRGEDVSAAVRLRHESQLAAIASELDAEEAHNPAASEVRLATEFGVDADALTNEHRDCGGSWGDLVIARTLRASAGFAITTPQVFALHRDGMAWTMVAHGMGLDVDDAVQAIETMRQVALGKTPADGRMPHIGAAGTAATSASSD